MKLFLRLWAQSVAILNESIGRRVARIIYGVIGLPETRTEEGSGPSVLGLQSNDTPGTTDIRSPRSLVQKEAHAKGTERHVINDFENTGQCIRKRIARGQCESLAAIMEHTGTGVSKRWNRLYEAFSAARVKLP
jgi:hypothetical protein